MVEVHCDERVAIYISPEPCVGAREGVGEASAGERTGQPLSRERVAVPDADAVQVAEGNTSSAISRAHRRSGVVEEPGMYGSSLCGNREVSSLTTTKVVRIGKARSRSR